MTQNMKDLMRQAQKMQAALADAQKALETVEVTGASGGGLVQVTMTARMQVRRVTLDPSLLGEDRDMLEDLLAAAMNDALRRAEAAAQERMGGLMGNLRIPGLS